MIDKNLILHLPFDDPDGNKAYDYSYNRSDATLSNGAIFSRDANSGKSLDLNGNGECLTERSIPFSSDFTLSMYVKPSTNKIGWLVNMNGIDNYVEQWINVTPNEWIFLCFVKSGTILTVYLGDKAVYNQSLPGTPVGMSINESSLSGCYTLIDEVKLYNVAKAYKDVLMMQQNTDVEYYINGKNFKEFGVFVSDSEGLVGRLERKETLQVDWDNYHGIVRDKKRPRFKERTITLSCFIEASSRSKFVEWLNLFLDEFDGEGNHRFVIEYDGTVKPLVYEVELHDSVDPDKKWGLYNNELMVGTFKLKLIEDEPVKKVLRHISNTANSEASITVTTYSMLNIYWGDGTHTYNVSGNNKTVEHTYADPGEYDIVITGVIEDIESFSTNAIVVWDKLK